MPAFISARRVLLACPGAPASALADDAGQILLTDDGQPILLDI